MLLAQDQDEPASSRPGEDAGMDGLGREERAGGASRDRTDDLRVANATLSQLSYGPSIGWWVWEELHPRPHPYQGCALTN